MMETSSGPHAPRIETERLRLRPHRLADLDDRIAITSEAGTMRFLGGPQDGDENFNRLLRYAGHWSLLGHGIFLVEERATGRMVGEVGLADFRRGLGPDFDGAPEAAWLIAGWAVGQGFATEAVAAALSWHEGQFGPQRTVCGVHPDNTPSLRVAAKFGFAPFREALFKGRPVLLHQRDPASPQMA